jgi:methyltransferase
MSPLALYYAILGLLVLERAVELVVADRNRRWSLRHGGVEHGEEHYRTMVALHTAFLASAALEPLVLDRPFVPALAAVATTLAVASQALRWWCIGTLGRRWNTRIIVIPGLSPIAQGPYRWLDHPNYVAVRIELAAVPMIHTAWLTALVFSVLNAILLRRRIRAEDAALGRTPAGSAAA